MSRGALVESATDDDADQLPVAVGPIVVRPSDPRTGRRRWVRYRRWQGLAYVLPAVAVYAAFVAFPALQALYLSFQRWNGLTASSWVGFDNYQAISRDPALLAAIEHALILILFFTVAPVLLALVTMAAIGPRGLRGLAIFRVVIALPQVIPLVAIGILWRWMYEDGGVVSTMLDWIRVPHPAEGWLGNFSTALPSVGVIGLWLMYGLCVILFLSASGRLDPDLYAAVLVDGGGRMAQFRTVTLPGIRPQIAVASTITVIAALSSFDIVFVATSGGPGDRTTVPSLLIYRLAFTDGQVGLASALAVCLSLLVIAVVLVIRRIGRTEESG